MKYLLN